MYTLSSHSNKTISSLTPSKVMESRLSTSLVSLPPAYCDWSILFLFFRYDCKYNYLIQFIHNYTLISTLYSFSSFLAYFATKKTVPKHPTQDSRSFHAYLSRCVPVLQGNA